LTPSRADFLSGQYFDIRLEVHAPVNGSQANGKQPDPNFIFTIAEGNSAPVNASTYFKVSEPALERWNFTWFEGEPHFLVLNDRICLLNSVRPFRA
jgi:hypothetical protein